MSEQQIPPVVWMPAVLGVIAGFLESSVLVGLTIWAASLALWGANFLLRHYWPAWNELWLPAVCPNCNCANCGPRNKARRREASRVKRLDEY
jgi:hypothetical protein